MKKIDGDIIILRQKSQSYDLQFLRYGVRHKIFFHFRPLFALLPPPLIILNIKILKKNEKNARRYYPFIHTFVP